MPNAGVCHSVAETVKPLSYVPIVLALTFDMCVISYAFVSEECVPFDRRICVSYQMAFREFNATGVGNRFRHITCRPAAFLEALWVSFNMVARLCFAVRSASQC